MGKTMFVFFVTVLLVACAKCDNFPSLLTANATLAVVIDRDYLGDEFEEIKNKIETYLIYAKREILRHGGVNVQLFTWANIAIKRDTTAIISIASCSDTWQLYRLAEDQQILHMAISEPDCPRMPPNKAITIPIVKAGKEISQIILDLRTVKAYKWDSATVIFDHTLDRDSIAQVSKSLTNDYGSISTSGSAISLIKLTTNSSFTQNRDTIFASMHGINVKAMGNNFLAIVSYDNMELLMEIAKSRNFVDTKKQWLYVISDTNGNNNSDITSAKRFLYEGDNVSFMYNTTINDAACKDGLQCYVEELLEAFSKALDAAIQEEFDLSSLVSDEEWEAIRPTKIERRDSLLNSIKSQLIQQGTCGNCSKWNFKAGDTWARQYQENNTLTAEIIDVGNWRPIDGCSMTDELFPHVAHGFRGKTLPMYTFHNPPWQILTINATGHIIEMKGLVFDIINELAKSLNFTYTLQIDKRNTSNNNTINDLNDGTEALTSTIPDFVVKLIQKKIIAISASGFTITSRAKQYVNFTMPISTQTYTFLVARPKELSRALLFMSPFSGYAWLCISCVLISMGPILFTIDKFSPVYKYKGISIKGGLASIQNCIWYMYGALLQQGGMHLPYADSSRIIVGSWWLVVLVISTTYCGNLVAFLTFPKIDIPIRTIEDILDHKDTVTWSIAKNSFFDQQLKVTTEPKYKALRNGMIPDNQDRNEMLYKIENGKHVYIDWKIKLQFLMKKQFTLNHRCDLALGSEEFFDEQIALIMSQDTPYLDIFNAEIKRLHQMGLIHKWLDNYLPKKDRCFKMKYNEVNNHTVNLDDMQGSFFVLIIGFTISLLIILSEKLWKNYMRKHQKNVITYTS